MSSVQGRRPPPAPCRLVARALAQYQALPLYQALPDPAEATAVVLAQDPQAIWVYCAAPWEPGGHRTWVRCGRPAPRSGASRGRLPS